MRHPAVGSSNLHKSRKELLEALLRWSARHCRQHLPVRVYNYGRLFSISNILQRQCKLMPFKLINHTWLTRLLPIERKMVDCHDTSNLCGNRRRIRARLSTHHGTDIMEEEIDGCECIRDPPWVNVL